MERRKLHPLVALSLLYLGMDRSAGFQASLHRPLRQPPFVLTSTTQEALPRHGSAGGMRGAPPDVFRTSSIAKATGGGDAGPFHHAVLIIGGGTGGISVAAQLKNEGSGDVCIIEPSATHYYQPMWSLIGAGMFRMSDSARPMASVIPRGVRWLQDAVTQIQPKTSTIRTQGGRVLTYDFLVVSAGLQCDWKAIPGLEEGLGGNGICSIYSPKYTEYTWEVLKSIKTGSILVTQPPPPIKCGGAPQKIMWLADDHLRRTGRRGQVEVSFATAGRKLFGLDKYDGVLTNLAKERGLEVLYGHRLTRVDSRTRTAVFKVEGGSEVRKPFDMLHVTPPMSAPDFLKRSPIANAAGFVEVDRGTTQHRLYPNVFALGDCSSLPTSKTMAAITAQAPVLVHNLIRTMNGKRSSARYNGYASCPVVLGYNQLLLTEFLYDGVVAESFTKLLPLPLFDQGRPSFVYFLVKKFVFPLAYWQLLTRGMWFGPKLIFKPSFEAEDAAVDAEDEVGNKVFGRNRS